MAQDSIDRASLISFAVRRGISAEMIAKRCETDVIGRFVELSGGRRGTSFEELAQGAGLDPELVGGCGLRLAWPIKPRPTRTT